MILGSGFGVLLTRRPAILLQMLPILVVAAGNCLTAPASAGEPSPIISMFSANWNGTGDAYLLSHFPGVSFSPIEIYRLPEESSRLEWVGTWENPINLAPSLSTSTELVILGPAEFIYWRGSLGYWLPNSPRIIEELVPATNRASFNKTERIYLRNNAGVEVPEFAFRLVERDLDSGIDTLIVEIEEMPGDLVSSGLAFPISNNQFMVQGTKDNGGGVFDDAVTYLIDLNTSPPGVTNWNPSQIGSFWIDHEDEVYIAAQVNGIFWFDTLQWEVVRSVGPMGLSQVRAHTNVTHFFGEPFAVDTGEKIETRVPVMVWEDDYTTRTLTHLVIDHPNSPPSPQDYIDHMLGTGRVNEVLFLEPDRNGDRKIDVSDLVQRVNELTPASNTLEILSEARTK